MRFLIVALSLVTGQAISQTTLANEQVLQSLAAIDQLQGEFQQTLYDEDGAALELSSGEFALLQPEYFSWHILAPDEQILVASPGSLWHYDVELETATHRSLDVLSDSSPIAILGAEPERVLEQYRVENAGGDAWRFFPRFDGADYLYLTLHLDDGKPQILEIADRLGRNTIILFSALDSESLLEPADFQFAPPAGVDIYQAN